MKKLLALLLVLFILTACVAENKSNSIETTNGAEPKPSLFEELNNNTNNMTETQENSITAEATNNQEVSSDETIKISISPMSIPAESFYDYDEYLSWLPTGKVTDRFVSYEMVSQFGAFHGVVFLNSYVNDYSIYMYSFFDSDGNDSVALYVDEKGEHGKPTLDETILQHTGNMVELSQPVKGSVHNEGIVYRYSGAGKLYSIYWEHNGMSFVLALDHPEYYENEDSLIAKLLNSNTAEAAMNQWIACLDEAVAE